MSTVEYRLRFKKSNNWARLSFTSNEGGYACGEFTVRLEDDDHGQIFIADSAFDAAKVLKYNTPWYNSSAERPSWGYHEPDDFEVVKLVIEEEVVDVSNVPEMIYTYLEPYQCFIEDGSSELFELLDINPNEFDTDQWQVSRMWGSKKKEPNARVCFVAKATLDDQEIQNIVGKYVFIDDVYFVRYIYRAIDAQEYDTRKMPGVILIMTEDLERKDDD